MYFNTNDLGIINYHANLCRFLKRMFIYVQMKSTNRNVGSYLILLHYFALCLQ